ncbi:transporter substrate-binding domain-containing protein [Blautia massiliensis (ex Durand et al. 2017)]|jgi:signal transduction histidine kinase/ABC-type amino acid transport substrate-binding protein/ActR/RegA family two-component response regulator|uniref:transporter substrate-binding domain-containing protein n=1 Tax=Blautia massiliensis (ex Durand et al. 2017) TaxID=1737424 RepID=UPI00156FF8A9|nr:transporter substrate-binding domain-containing protein [Blautia massiliensis (ex Durand et al. 2017)]MBS4887024.1 transporter substrate-binding domain-containing protein [Clostridiales bacterium]NSG49151.1 transporter substrate-binding domain-containing protein [Blautia massiliensis (ex Durand et al. 2017)]NSL01036.1 transporter substrate-binding domain-containing protein [Blautia massiliensis (ex Durand et al. 2017)]
MDKSRKKSTVLCAGIFVFLGIWMVLTVPCRAAETNNDEKQSQIIRVGSFEDTFNYVDKNGVRRGYGYELMQALAGYTGWKFEYVKCDWSDCFDKLENGEIDIMGDISYTDERAQKMLFPDEPMGEEKYILYADLSDTDIGMSDFKSLDGKRVGVLMDTEPEIMLTEWENKNGIHTEHVNVNNDDDVEKKLANHEIDCFVSLEESIWSEQGISSVTTIGKSGIYFAINKERSDIKTELDYAMRQLEQDSPFFKADLYKKYFTLDYIQILTGKEKVWVEEHGGIQIGFLNNDPAIFSMDEETGKITGMLAEYISYAKDCLGNQTLEFNIHAYDDYDEMIQALQNREIDMIFYAGRNPYFAEQNGYALTNTAWTYSLMAVTDEEKFDENKVYTVAVPKEKYALKQHIAFSYPEWKLVDCDSLDNAADMVIQEKADCFLMGASQALIYDNSQNFKSVPLTKTMEACFTVREGEGSLLSILNKTIKAMPSDMLTSALAIYDSTADKVTFSDFIKDNLLVFLATVGFLALSIIGIILVLLRKARKAEAVAKLAAKDTKKLNDKLEIALKKAEDASLAKTRFLNNMSHDIRTPMNAILGYAQLMEEELKEKDLPETSDHLEKLQQSGNLLLSIINNVLDMARIESGKMEIDENYGRIEDIRQTLFEIFGDEAKKKNIALHYTINVEHEHILTDTTKVKEIFVNILSNAIKYTPSGGSVMINIDELVCDEPGYMMVRTRVSDTGIGMSQDYLTKIFDAFTRERNTTKSKIAGSGLGMSIVKRYVDLLGGTIDVESEPGKGSTFTVTLKHRIADESYYVKKHDEGSGTASKILEGRNILLAEDNDLNAEIAEAILERAGLKTERVEDGIQCVNKITKMPVGTYDMILMDIQMPRMDGYKATQAIRHLPDKDKACIPIVAMTANAFEEDKRDAVAAGMNGHIAKPIQIDKLLSMLAEVLRQ